MRKIDHQTSEQSHHKKRKEKKKKKKRKERKRKYRKHLWPGPFLRFSPMSQWD